MRVWAEQRHRLPSRQLERRFRGPLLGCIRLRLRTKWRVGDIDRQLADGADPIRSDELSLRAGQLGSQRTRTRLYQALRHAVDLANGHFVPLITTRLRRTEVQQNEQPMAALSERPRPLTAGIPVR